MLLGLKRLGSLQTTAKDLSASNCLWVKLQLDEKHGEDHQGDYPSLSKQHSQPSGCLYFALTLIFPNFLPGSKCILSFIVGAFSSALRNSLTC